MPKLMYSGITVIPYSAIADAGKSQVLSVTILLDTIFNLLQCDVTPILYDQRPDAPHPSHVRTRSNVNLRFRIVINGLMLSKIKLGAVMLI